jgi:hypothetical protein
MFCTGSTEVKILVLTDAVLSKLVGAEDTIVRVVLFDEYAAAPSFCLNTLLAKDGTGGRKISLRLMKDLGTGMVDKHCSTNVSIAMSCFAISFNSTTAGGRDIVIHGDALARDEIIGLQNHFSGIRGGFGGLRWSFTTSFCHETRRTFAVESLLTRRGAVGYGKNGIDV